MKKISFRGVLESDAAILYPLIHNTSVTDTLIWDGPVSLEEYREFFKTKEHDHKAGKAHYFTIMENETPIGSATIKPMNDFRGEITIWIGVPFHGKGYGSEVTKLITDYGFNKLQLQRIEASMFIDNHGSRKMLEKNGFSFEGTTRSSVKKRGEFVDGWLFSIIRKN